MWRWLDRPRNSIVLGALWVLITQYESLLGPLARPEWGDGDRLFLGYFGYLAAHGSQTFLPELMGGVDRFGVGRIGGEYVSLRLLLLHMLPLWSVVVVFRFAVTAVALLGVYLFARRLLGASPALALALGALYSIAFDFTCTLTFLYGFSLSAMPLLFYVLFAGCWRATWLGGAGVVVVAIVTTADPVYWLPVSWICCLAIRLWLPPRRVTFALGGLTALSVLWVANYADTLAGFLALLPYSARLSNPVTLGLSDMLGMHAWWLLRPRLWLNQGGPAFVAPVLVAVVGGVWWRHRDALVAAAAALVVAFAPPFLGAIPWRDVGLMPLASYRWYWEYGAISIALLAGARGATGAGRALAAPTVGIAIALALAMQVVVKQENLNQAAGRGNLTELADIPNLREASWRTDRDARVVAIPTQMDPNTLVAYGFANLDGGATLVHRDLHTFWSAGVMRGEPKPARELLGFGFHPAFLGCCAPLHIDEIVDLDLLRLASVGYVVSRRQLQSVMLTQVSGPAGQSTLRGWRRALSWAPPAFVYRLENPLPRVYAAAGVTTVPDGVPPATLMDHLRRDAINDSRAVVSVRDGAELSNVPTKARVLPYSIRSDGIDVEVPDRAGALVVVGAPYLPWWTATTDNGTALTVRPANLIHMTVAVPSGVKTVSLRYARPLIRDLWSRAGAGH